MGRTKGYSACHPLEPILCPGTLGPLRSLGLNRRVTRVDPKRMFGLRRLVHGNYAFHELLALAQGVKKGMPCG